jgi:hypothetical protein
MLEVMQGGQGVCVCGKVGCGVWQHVGSRE